MSTKRAVSSVGRAVRYHNGSCWGLFVARSRQDTINLNTETETESCSPWNWSRMQGRVTGPVPGWFNSSRNSIWQRLPCQLRRRSAASRLLGLRVRTPPRAWMPVCCTDLCDGPIPCAEEFYRVCVCVTQCDQVQQYLYTYREVGGRGHIIPLTLNDHYSGRAVSLTSKRCILYTYSTNIGTEYFKHGLYSPFFFFKMQFVS